MSQPSSPAAPSDSSGDAELTLSKRVAQLTLLNDVSREITSALQVEQLLDLTARLIHEKFGYHHVGLFVFERDQGELTLRARAGKFTPFFASDHHLALNSGIVGWVARHNRRLLANDVRREPTYVNYYGDQIPTQSELSIPLQIAGEILGVLDIQSPQLDAFDENDARAMETLAGQIAVALHNAHLYEATQRELQERERAERIMRARLRLMEFADSHTLAEVAQATLDEAEDLTDSRIGFYHFLEADQRTLSLQSWSTRTLREMYPANGQESHHPVDQAGVWADCIRERRPVIHNDYTAVPQRRDLPEGHVQVIREVVIPVFRGEQIVSVLGVGNKPQDYTNRDVETLATLADLAWDIFERKQALQALQESEFQLKRSQEVAHVGHWTWDTTTNQLAWSDEMYRIFGITQRANQLDLNAIIEAAIHPEDREKVRRSNEAMLTDQRPGTIEYRVVWADGSIHHVWVGPADRVVDADGKIVKLSGVAQDITARKRVEEELRKLSRAVEQSPATIVITNTTGDIEYVNPRFTQTTGYTFNEAIGQNPRILKSGHTTAAEYKHLWDTITAGNEWRGEFHNRKKNGELYWEAATIAPIWNEQGEINHFLAVKEDITARKQAEEALQVSEEKFAKVFRDAPVWIAITDLNSAIYLDVNEETLRASGFSREEVIGHTSVELGWITEDDRVRLVQEIQEHRQITGMEMAFNAKDGRSLHGWVSGEQLVIDGRPCVLTVTVDITARRQAEEALRQSEQRYRRQARELSALNRAGRALTSTLDVSKLLWLVIDEIKNLSGAEAASVLLYEAATEELRFAACVGPEADRLQNLRMSTSAGIAGWVLRERLPVLVGQAHSDERFYPGIDALTGLSTHSLIAVPLIHGDTPLGVIEAINNVGEAFDDHDLILLEGLAALVVIALENAQLYEAERAQYRRLRETQAEMIHVEKMAALGRLMASVAHEINNPLQAVQGCLGLGLEELHGKQRHAKLDSYLRMAAGEIDRIALILARMRDFYRPAGEEQRPTDVHAILRSVLELSHKQLQQSQITVRREWDLALPPIIANADHLKQVFLNLVLNAIDALTPQGGTLQIRTAPDQLVLADRPIAQAVRIEFSDTGQGIPPDVLPRIFEPFFSAKKGGSGLGLSISYGIIEAHHGQITATSEPGAGTTFTVMLPIAQP